MGITAFTEVHRMFISTARTVLYTKYSKIQKQGCDAALLYD